MHKSPNKLWAFGPIISIVLIAVAYYLKVPAFRDAVNTHIPWAKEHLTQFVPPPEIVIVGAPERVAIPTPPASMPPVAEKIRQTSPPTPVPEAHDGRVTIQAFAANQSLWPKTVTLRCSIEFPAVLNGKVIGKVHAPAGTQARLVTVRDQQLGVEYRGGGAWVPVSQTDLMEKVKITLR